MESLAYTAFKQVGPPQLQNFYEFLRGYTDIFSKNILSSNDETCKNLKNLIRKNDIVILRKITYKKKEDTTLQDLKENQNILYRNFYTYKNYKSMYPHSNQPAKL